MPEHTVSTAERAGTILLAATVGAIVTTLVAHPLIEGSLEKSWRDSGGTPGAVTFQAQEAFIVSSKTTSADLAALPVTKIHSKE